MGFEEYYPEYYGDSSNEALDGRESLKSLGGLVAGVALVGVGSEVLDDPGSVEAIIVGGAAVVGGAVLAIRSAWVSVADALQHPFRVEQ